MSSPQGGSYASSVEDKSENVVAQEGSYSEEPVRGGSWFRGTLFQATVVGACAFLSPGIFNAMNATGAGGAQSPYLVNAANACVFGLMVVTCFFASSITNRLGYRWALFLGCIGYAPYAAGLYCNKLYGTTWLVLFGAVTCGLSAGLFWGVEGAVILGYPEPEKRGKYLAYWLGWRNAGSILGGAILLGINSKANTVGSVGSSTYIVFIALQAFAPFVSVLLSNPDQVHRKDGSHVVMANHVGFAEEMREMWAIIKRPEVALLAPLALYAQWTASYAGTFFSLYFSVRARSLGSLLVPILSIIANTILGYFLDAGAIRKNVRSKASYLAIMALVGGVWVWFTVLQLRFIASPPKYDWSSAGFGSPFACYLIFYVAYYLVQNELYWLIAALAREPKELVRLSSFLRGLESAGSACGFGISAKKTLSKKVPLAINFGLWGVTSVIAWFTVKEIGASIDYRFATDREGQEQAAAEHK